MASPTNLQEGTTPVFDARNLELESIDFFVRLMSMLGMPRSVGEIYGVLYFSKDSLPMDRDRVPAWNRYRFGKPRGFAPFDP